MKELRKTLLILGAVYLLIAIIFVTIFGQLNSQDGTGENVALNRINTQLSNAVISGEQPEKAVASRMDGWQSEYGKDCPLSIEFISAKNSENSAVMLSDFVTVSMVYSSSGEFIGLYRYEFARKVSYSKIILLVAVIFVSFLITTAFAIYIYVNIVKPFRKLSEYPNRLARLHTNQKLPESKSRYFGKYIWGMNMLCDMLESDRKNISRLESDRKTLLASLAHGIKTPVANIRLYAQAMKIGMYKSKEEFTETADKIEQNCIKLEKLTVEILNTSAVAITSFVPEINQFYLNELGEMIESEFSNRLRVKMIPFTVEIERNIIITSDKWAIFRVISQLMENAIKYGNGQGIAVSIFTQEDDLCISVKNKGELLPESEIPYIFKSFWRGSNAAGVEGSGVGLYTAKEVTKVLGGSIYARRLEESSEMEFVVCLEKY